MVKKFKIKIKDTEDYVSLYNGIFKLSPTEIEILAKFIDVYIALKNSSININPFSTEIKKRVSRQLGRDDFNTLNNYIKSLADKKAIRKATDGYDFHPMLLPLDEEKVEFTLIHE